MGCDVQFTGSQPNARTRERCLRFLRRLVERKPAELRPWLLTYERLRRIDADPEPQRGTYLGIDAFADSVYAQTPVVRRARGAIFRIPEEQCRAYEACPVPAEWSERGFSGVMIDGFPIVFDNLAGGVLCSLRRDTAVRRDGEKERGDWPEWFVDEECRGPCSRIEAFVGCSTRVASGYPVYFVVAAVLKRRFMPDLVVLDDFKVWEDYQWLLRRTGYLRLFDAVPEDDLAEAAIEASIQTGMLFHFSAEKKLELLERNEKRVMAIREEKSWKTVRRYGDDKLDADESSAGLLE